MTAQSFTGRGLVTRPSAVMTELSGAVCFPRPLTPVELPSQAANKTRALALSGRVRSHYVPLVLS
jgi:hypothetical protein